MKELRDRVTRHPEHLSPKAALRPLYQDFVLPTVAYVAGPGEVAYQAQIQPFYKTLSVVAPSLFPRLSVTLVDEKVLRLGQRVGLTLRKVLEGEFDAVVGRMLDRADDSAAGTFREVRRKLEEALSELKESVGELDATLEGAAGTTLGKMMHLLDGLEKKAQRALKQKHATELGRLRKLFGAVKPRALLNEEGLSTAYFLLRFDRAGLLAALDEAPLDGKRHAVVSVSEEASGTA